MKDESRKCTTVKQEVQPKSFEGQRRHSVSSWGESSWALRLCATALTDHCEWRSLRSKGQRLCVSPMSAGAHPSSLSRTRTRHPLPFHIERNKGSVFPRAVALEDSFRHLVLNKVIRILLDEFKVLFVETLEWVILEVSTEGISEWKLRASRRHLTGGLWRPLF